MASYPFTTGSIRAQRYERGPSGARHLIRAGTGSNETAPARRPRGHRRRDAGGRRRLARLMVDGRSRPSRSTTPRREPEARSRGSCCPSPRHQVAPLVWLVGRMLVVGGVAGVHLSGSVANEQCSKGLVNECGVGGPRAHAARSVEQLSVHGCAQPCAIHAPRMPLPGCSLGHAMGYGGRRPS